LTHALNMRRDAYSTRPAPRFTPVIRAPHARERGWVFDALRGGIKDSSIGRRMKWRDFKLLHTPLIEGLLARPDTRVLVAADPVSDIGAAWIAFATGWSVDVVHWVVTSLQHRRHGLMTALIAAVVTRPNCVYTFEAPPRPPAERADLWITERLSARGVVASHIPYAEWSK
jgi:hypothetical protein